MNCPQDDHVLEPVKIGPVTVERCSQCGGTWYEKDELRLLKDKEAHGDYRWLDFDLWKDVEKFRSAEQRQYACPKDGQQLVSVIYGDSSITVDVCSQCHGVWLDSQEYKAIVNYLDSEVNRQSAGDYIDDLREEFKEIFTGPESTSSEIKDFTKVMYLLQLRVAIDNPALVTFIRGLPGA
jgi:Zn-finger nucleic acid-binding protein